MGPRCKAEAHECPDTGKGRQITSKNPAQRKTNVRESRGKQEETAHKKSQQGGNSSTTVQTRKYGLKRATRGNHNKKINKTPKKETTMRNQATEPNNMQQENDSSITQGPQGKTETDKRKPKTAKQETERKDTSKPKRGQNAVAHCNKGGNHKKPSNTTDAS